MRSTKTYIIYSLIIFWLTHSIMSFNLLKHWKETVYISVGGILTYSVYSIYKGKRTFYDKFLMPVFHTMDPETSHRFAIKFAKLGIYLVPQYEEYKELGTKIGHLVFSNPVGIAAGFDKNAEAVESLMKMGFGFVEVGSVTPLPQEGNQKPRVFRIPENKAIINRYGFNSDGHDVVLNRLNNVKKIIPSNYVVGVNLGRNKITEDAIGDYASGVQKFQNVAQYYVVNISSPNTSGLRDLQKKENLKELLAKVISVRNNLNVVPLPLVFVKLSPDLNSKECEEIAKIILQKECRIDGLIISNTTVQRDFDLKGSNINEVGGLSGKPLNELSTDMISRMYKLTKGTIPIIGVGGIFGGKDAYEKIKCGASLIQIYTSFAYHGPPIIHSINEELLKLLKADGYSNISEAVGSSFRH